VSKQVHLQLHLPDKLPSLAADKDLMRVAILNILTNAIKYTPEHGSITFTVEEVENSLRVVIADTGYGIAEDELPHIFDKFFRSADEKIKAHTGNGLGLALSREIIRLHDGEITVTSAIGQGTHVTVTLPTDENARVKSYSRGLHSLLET
jgi:signal transduction histidine kinase